MVSVAEAKGFRGRLFVGKIRLRTIITAARMEILCRRVSRAVSEALHSRVDVPPSTSASPQGLPLPILSGAAMEHRSLRRMSSR